MSQIDASLVTDFDGLTRLREDWNRIWGSTVNNTVFTSFAWAHAAARAHGSGLRLCMPVVRRAGEVVVILPTRFDEDKIVFLGSPNTDYNDVLCAPGAGDPAISLAVRSFGQATAAWRHINLDNLAAESRLMGWFQTAPPDLRRQMHVSISANCR